ncbi:MAG: glycosyltransferase [Planctomycetes bacterium]|nr:glycosyltransferase [Planctomycetota bacterium]
MANPELPISVLIATKNRDALLLNRALPSVQRQWLQPDLVVLVSDGRRLPQELLGKLRAVIAPTSIVALENGRSPGAASAWNTGLSHLDRLGTRGFVAILDDDDEWDAEHLQECMTAAGRKGANIVVSGLRRMVNGSCIPRPLPRELSVDDFLVGNPGWQGSNTFVELDLMLAVGGFTDGLLSLNDRDLAIRLLRHHASRLAYTGKWTATWHHDAAASLSAPRSRAKISGLRRFWSIHGRAMTPAQSAAFFDRACRYFGVLRDEIIADGPDLLSTTSTVGGSCAAGEK